MLVNKFIMQDCGISDKDILFIRQKAIVYKSVKCFDKHVLSPRNHILSIVHFDLLVMIEAQKEVIKTIRADAVPRNKEVLGLLEKMRDELILKLQMKDDFKLMCELEDFSFNEEDYKQVEIDNLDRFKKHLEEFGEISEFEYKKGVL